MIIVFNGPPGSGKDHACEYLVNNLGFEHLSFKKKLLEDVMDYYDLSEENRNDFISGYDDRAKKEIPVGYLNGKSRREAMIHVSENVMKPIYGANHYGEAALNGMRRCVNYCFSDSGFVEELRPIWDKYNNKEKIAIVQIFRDGHNFSSDSRCYIDGNLRGIYTDDYIPVKYKSVKAPFDIDMYQIVNDGSKDDFEKNISRVMRRIRDNEGPNNFNTRCRNFLRRFVNSCRQ